MKELSIEQKAKAYDEALERASKLRVQNPFDTVSQMMEHVFPELKESEDERIRKELIMMVKLSCTDGDDVDKKIAWLERQVEQKPAWSEEAEEYVNSLLKRLEGLCRNEFATTRFAISEDEDWLKSLKDRVQPHDKCKESLATADLENSLCDIQDGFSDTSYEYRTLGEAIEFIRCTESKPQWKPSDEQMENLSRAFNGGTYRASLLMELYQDLKKLK